MIFTHIFLVILATIILIILAEHQNLRNITWILLLGCLTYIVFLVAPEGAESTISENSGQNIIDTTIVNIQPKTIDPIINDIIPEPQKTIQNLSDNAKIKDNVQNINILSISMAKEIDDKMPVGVSRIFLNDIETIFCFTAVDNTIKDNKIVHTWKRNKQDYLKSFITIGDSPNWRCWSRITIRPEMIGEWQVVVTDSVGNYLNSIDFSIIPISE